MENIDLQKIHDDIMGDSGSVTFPGRVKKMMTEAIRQALVLASDRAKASRERVYTNKSKSIYSMKCVVDKQSILDVKKLIK